MPLVKLRRAAQITLPSAIRRSLGLREGDYLEAEIVEGGVMLKPVTVTERDAARERLMAALSGSRYVGTEPEPEDDELMDRVVEEIKADRQTRRESRS